MRKLVIILVLTFSLLALYAWQCVPSSANVVCRIISPEPRLIVAQVDFTPAERSADSMLWTVAQNADPWWVWGHEGRAAQWRRPQWISELKDVTKWKISGHTVRRLGSWSAPVGQTRLRGRPVLGADVICHVYLELEEPLSDGERIQVTTPFGKQLHFVRKSDEPSPFIKVNQVGYAASASRRFAYVGGWLGTSGAWIPPAEAVSFDLVEAETGKPVLSGNLTQRPELPPTKEGTPWNGEKTLCADLSGDVPAGRYFLRVPGVGRSLPFAISDDAVRQALAVHLHGLFVQRCGCKEKGLPRTAWEDAACHLRVWRGTFPPDAGDYVDGHFVDAGGAKIKVDSFDLIKRNTDWSVVPESFPGGWHDAADYDRRPFHLQVVSDLASVCLLKGSRTPDGVLEEAAWGLEHLRAAQTPEGSVGGWIETTRHPVEGEGLPSADRLTYALSRPTRASTLAYASVASELACCSPQLKTRFLDSAMRAWRWVREATPATNVSFLVSAGKGERTVFWNETEGLSVRDELKTVINLSVATGNPAYLDVLDSESFRQRFDQALACEAHGWSPLSLLEAFACDDRRLDSYRERLSRWLVARGEKALIAQEQQPYRMPRLNGEDLAWGHSHPLPIARGLIAAYVVSRRAEFLAGAYLANDFHCGCNPDGMTMTSGLGRIYPVRFLSLASTADAVGEYVAGVTPYRWTYGVGLNDYRLIHTEDDVKCWPIWRRRVTLESLNVPTGEYTVWETIGPAAAVTAWLAAEGMPATIDAELPLPHGNPEDLPGYWALP